jgi:5-formyltetrahydrofolate cyclo-ligase
MGDVALNSEMSMTPSATDWGSVNTWRKETRARLLNERVGLAGHFRRAQSDEAKRRLVENVDFRKFESIGLYWPIRGEIDCRDIARAHVERGGIVALPVVVERGAPVEFWRWRPGTRMSRGLWDIPIPAERDLVHPDALIVPLIGFDSACYRLGYGGGYYDRTLAAAAKRPFCVGLGYNSGALSTIYPQTHDIPLDAIVSDRILIRTQAQ